MSATPQNVTQTVDLEIWDGPWDDGDRDANFKHDVALYCRLDPLSTLTNVSQATDIPIGALCRYILAKWASAGAEALMTIGASSVTRMADTIEAAERADSDDERLVAYHEIAEQIAWLRYPLANPDVYP